MLWDLLHGAAGSTGEGVEGLRAYLRAAYSAAAPRTYYVFTELNSVA